MFENHARSGYLSCESAKLLGLRGFLGNVGCVVEWLVGDAGQIVASVAQVAWVYKILVWVNKF